MSYDFSSLGSIFEYELFKKDDLEETMKPGFNKIRKLNHSANNYFTFILLRDTPCICFGRNIFSGLDFIKS